MLFLLGIRWARLRGARVVWTVHNLQPHDPGRRQGAVAWAFWRLFPRAVDAFVTLSRAGVPAILDRFPALRGKPYSVVPHGHYLGTYDDTVTRDQARQRVGIPEQCRVYLNFGQVRRYKNVPGLIGAFRGLRDDDARLVVAGSVDDPALAREIADAARGDERILLHLEFVPLDDVQTYLRAADLVVLPFSEVFNSGSAMLALSFDRGVLIPDVPTFRELQAIVGAEWVHLFDGEVSAADLERALAATPIDDTPCLDAFDWDVIAERTMDLYRRIRR